MYVGCRRPRCVGRLQSVDGSLSERDQSQRDLVLGRLQTELRVLRVEDGGRQHAVPCCRVHLLGGNSTAHADVGFCASLKLSRGRATVCQTRLVMAALRSTCGHYIFALSFLLSFFLLFFFPHLISAVADWMSTILPHMVWP